MFILLTGACSLILGFLLLLYLLTFGFKRIERVESEIATPGKQLEQNRKIWGNGPIGRWVRIIHIYGFFVFSKIPHFGPRFKGRMGDDSDSLTTGMKLWVVLPTSLFYLATILFFVCAWALGAYD